MSPRRLLIGLGNPLAGDDGVGCRIARRVRSHPRLPADVDVVTGTDLLRLQSLLRARPRVVIVDALLAADDPPGTLTRFHGDLEGLDDGDAGAHAWSPAGALKLLRAVDPRIRDVPVTFLGVAIDGGHVSPCLSGDLDARLDDLANRVLAALSD